MRTVWWFFAFVVEYVCLCAGLKLCDGYIVGADVRFFAVFTGDCPLQFIEGDVEFNGHLIASPDTDLFDQLGDDHLFSFQVRTTVNIRPGTAITRLPSSKSVVGLV